MIIKNTLLVLVYLIITIIAQVSFAKKILITASTGNIGTAVSFDLAEHGYDLILSGRNQEKLDLLKEQISKKYDNLNISTMIIDFSNIKQIRNSISEIISDKLDGIVLIGSRPSLNINDIPSPKEWELAFKETFIAPLEAIKLLKQKMNNNSSIVIISGSTSRYSMRQYPNYNVIRLAWKAEIKNLVHHLKDKKIRVNSVPPSAILTSYHTQKIKKQAEKHNISIEKQMEINTDDIPLKAYASLFDVASSIKFLLSEESKYINGTDILLDGGMSNSY